MTFQTFASKLEIKHIIASTVSSNYYILALHIASITFDKEKRKYYIFMRNISEKQFEVDSIAEMERIIKLQLAQFYVDSLCNVKEDIKKAEVIEEEEVTPFEAYFTKKA